MKDNSSRATGRNEPRIHHVRPIGSEKYSDPTQKNYRSRYHYNWNHSHLQSVEESDEKPEETDKCDSNYPTGNANGFCYGQPMHAPTSRNFANDFLQVTKREKLTGVHYQISNPSHDRNIKEPKDLSRSRGRVKSTDVCKKQKSYVPCLTRSAILKQFELGSLDKASSYTFQQHPIDTSFPASLGESSSVNEVKHFQNRELGFGDSPENSIFTIRGQKTVTDSSVRLKDKTGIVETGETKLMDPCRNVETVERESESIPTTSPSIEKKRKRRQCTSEFFSLIFFVNFVVLSSLAPWLSIPSYVVANKDQDLFKLIMFGCTLTSFVFLFIGCILGNFYWYIDEKTGRWRVMLHCGKGPKPYYWGWIFSWGRSESDKNHSQRIETV
ncbi:uncharacterized protein LOC111083211 [Limulus polyphemus]|uniref:Uncharacterized protein LOC111083211 n=1 Tax=Limulus polyphemus TaxID=6850 RepID=A0ABM1RV56_LIMPO|nr:uncharacterized protein LOC111083211 [Limulus polyphemus]